MKKLRDARYILLLKPSTFKTHIRYFVAASCGFCIDFLIYAALVALGVSVYLANALGFCVGAVITVILIRAFVFPDSRFRLGADLQLTFVTNGAMFVLGMGMLWVLIYFAALNPYFAKLLTNGTTFVLNYVVRAVFFRAKSNVF